MLRLDDLIEATGTKTKILLRGAETFPGLSIDSRTINKDELFIALAGDRFDGHDYVAAALEVGAGAVIGRPLEKIFSFCPDKGKSVLLVEDTLKALQAIAHHIRMKRPGMPVIGVTGSNGKTTTKELAALVLGRRFEALKSSGNFNNQIGLPLNLCRLDAGHGAAVLEMGASRPGDIAELCAIARPTHGIITNVSESHLEGFSAGDGSGPMAGAEPMRALINTKLELARSAQAVVYNADDPRLREAVLGEFGGEKKKTLISFGMKQDADLRAEDIAMEAEGSVFRLSGRGQSTMAKLRAAGLFNVYNALAAAAAGLLFDITLSEAAAAMAEFSGVPMRYGMREAAGVLILGDVYNANPASMEAAIEELVRLRGRRAVAVLGDMLELGRYSEEAHRRLGACLARLPVDVFIAVGPMMEAACAEFSAVCGGGSGRLALSCADSVAAAKALMENLRTGDTVLVKGSRGVRMERVLENMPGQKGEVGKAFKRDQNQNDASGRSKTQRG